MRNATRDHAAGFDRLPPEAVAALRMGWDDAARLPARFSPRYETMPQGEQMLYEFARLVRANIVAAGLAVPPMHGGWDHLAFEHVAGRAAHDVGPAFPRWAL